MLTTNISLSCFLKFDDRVCSSTSFNKFFFTNHLHQISYLLPQCHFGAIIYSGLCIFSEYKFS